jgi:Ca-activated chloride channel family protein
MGASTNREPPMHADVRLSTKFLTTQNAHQVGILVGLAGETPVRRAPINVALVLDRSGSMDGPPLEAAMEAARRFVGFLSPQDRLAVVTFDDEVHTVFGPAPADASALAAIDAIAAGGSTNLSGGWLMGMRHVRAGLVDGTNRVVLLTDGQANVGVVEVPQLVGMAKGGREARVTTTCIGFGAHFNEDLLEPMSKGGGGNYWYVERDDQMAAIFEEEISGLVALAAQNVEVEVELVHPRAAGVSFLQSYPVQATPQGTWRVSLGDLYATGPRALGVVLHVEEVRELGAVEVARVRITADVVGEGGIEQRVVVMPVMANLDGADHPEPTVESTFIRFEAARAREEAVRRADGGDFGGAAACLRAAREALARGAEAYGAPPELDLELADLDRSAERLERRVYDASERKYQAAMSMSAREMKESYRRRMRRE